MRRQGFQEGFIRGGLLEVSWRDFWARSQKYLKWPPGGFLARLLSLGPEMLQNGLLEASWTDFCARNQKCFKMPSWRPPGKTFGLGARNATKLPPGGLLERLFGQEPPGGLLPRLLSLEPEMLQNDLLEVSWRDFWARSQKAWFLEPYQSVVRICVHS